MEILQEKCDACVAEGLVAQSRADAIMAVIAAERGESGVVNDQAIEDDAVAAGAGKMLSQAQLQELLTKREQQMQDGGTPENPTDQWRVYNYIRDAIANPNGKYLRLMVQASAGTGAPNSILVWHDLDGSVRAPRSPHAVETRWVKASCSRPCICIAFWSASNAKPLPPQANSACRIVIRSALLMLFDMCL